MRFRRSALALRQLCDRVLPTAILHYTDVDGDIVTVRTSAGTDADLPAVASFDASMHQLQALFLNNKFAGTSVSITAKPGSTGGNGLVNVGYISATGTNLGAVSVHGDLGRIDAGAGTANSVAVKSLTAMSMGRFGTTTQGPFSSLLSNLHGALGSLTVHGDLDGVSIAMSGPNGKAGPVHIGGSLIGGWRTGEIRTSGALGPVSIGGDLVGGGISLNGSVTPTGIIAAGGKLIGLTIGGSVFGGVLDGSGQVTLGTDAGPIRIAGNLVGGGGNKSGSISGLTLGMVASVSIGGSLVPGPSQSISGLLDMGNDTIGSMTVGGNLLSSITVNRSASVVVHGSIGDSTNNGYFNANTLGDVRIGGSLTGAIGAARIASLIVGGSVHGGIWAYSSLGRLVIRGSLVNSSVSCMGPLVPDGKPSVGIGSLTVFGRVENSQIVAGYDILGVTGNADVQIGAVTVHGDWIASDLAAGIAAGYLTNTFGDNDDSKITGGAAVDRPHSHSRIGPVVIQGQLLGTPGNASSHGIEAEELVSLSVSGTSIHLKPGRGNDTTAIRLGAVGDVVAREF
ncbi:MAG TPA: hypothetical protein VHR66_28080 [Gemmataceae bacterium]|jgi:hypothetical protein|nr:hypothetical protein [Gemmataceae bacterium]